MVMGRNRCVVKDVRPKKVISHNELMNRLRKSFYYGADTSYDDMEISRPLAEYASELFSESHKGHSLNRLNFVQAGGLHANPCTLIMALIYLDRLNVTDPNYIRRITPSELFIVSMMISTKIYCGYDEDVYLNEWANQGNISEKQMKQLEIEFLHAIEWNVYISNNHFFEKLESVEKILAHREGIRRGWLTYTELINLLPSFTIAKFFFNNIAVMAASYAASVFTIAGAFFIVSHIPGNAFKNRNVVHENSIAKTDATTITTDLCSNNMNISTNAANAPDTNVRNTMAELNDDSDENATCLVAIIMQEKLKTLERKFINDHIKNIETHLIDNKKLPIFDYKESLLNLKTNIETNWQNIIDENPLNQLKNYTESILLYLLRSNHKPIISLPFLTWFKFI